MTQQLIRYDASVNPIHRDKTAWLAVARLLFTPSRREPCNVCGRYANVAEAHHITPLSIQFERGAETADHTHVWLCPTHHAIVHVLINAFDRNNKSSARRIRSFGPEMSDGEFDLSMNLAKKVWL